MEALNRESLRAFLYGMDVGDCATIGNDSAEGGGNGSRFWFGSAVVKYFRTPVSHEPGQCDSLHNR